MTATPPKTAAEAIAAPEAEAIATPETKVGPTCYNSPAPSPIPPSDITAAIPLLEVTASVTTPSCPEAHADGSSILEFLFGTSNAEAPTPLSDLIEGMHIFLVFFWGVHSHVISLAEAYAEVVPLTQKGKKTKQPRCAPVARLRHTTQK